MPRKARAEESLKPISMPLRAKLGDQDLTLSVSINAATARTIAKVLTKLAEDLDAFERKQKEEAAAHAG